MQTWPSTCTNRLRRFLSQCILATVSCVALSAADTQLVINEDDLHTCLEESDPDALEIAKSVCLIVEKDAVSLDPATGCVRIRVEYTLEEKLASLYVDGGAPVTDVQVEYKDVYVPYGRCVSIR